MQIGGTQVTNSLLKSEFPNLTYHLFPSYGISYPQKGEEFLRHIVRQLPRIASVIKEEGRITERLAKQYQFDLIISDNRFGVRASAVKNIFISHQLNLSIPQSSIVERIANWINRRYINKYDQVAIPDWESHLLSGDLSNTKGIKPKFTFLGNLSRWNDTGLNKEQKGLLVILSGPEPQRSLFEDMIAAQSAHIEESISIVRAKPADTVLPKHDGIKFYNHLAAGALQQLVEESAIIISRAGYSTIMDLVAVRKHGVLIPTPGQTEQEYLVEHLQAMNLFTFYNQSSFNLVDAISEFNKKEWGEFPSSEINLKKKVEALIS